jgi:hypothetical protein
MQKKIVLLIVLIIIVIGVWLYLFFTSQEPRETTPETEVPEETVPLAPLSERYEFEGIEYEIISMGGPVYDIITGEITEEQTGVLAEKIIGDILTQEPAIQELTLLFYSDLITLGVGEVDVAEINWTPKEISVKMK